MNSHSSESAPPSCWDPTSILFQQAAAQSEVKALPCVSPSLMLKCTVSKKSGWFPNFLHQKIPMKEISYGGNKRFCSSKGMELQVVDTLNPSVTPRGVWSHVQKVTIPIVLSCNHFKFLLIAPSSSEIMHQKKTQKPPTSSIISVNRKSPTTHLPSQRKKPCRGTYRGLPILASTPQIQRIASGGTPSKIPIIIQSLCPLRYQTCFNEKKRGNEKKKKTGFCDKKILHAKESASMFKVEWLGWISGIFWWISWGTSYHSKPHHRSPVVCF